MRDPADRRPRTVILFRTLFWLALAFAYVAAVMPQQEAPTFSSSDKVEHMVAFLTLSILAGFGYSRAAILRIGAALAGFGALIEFTQMIPALHRDGNLADWIADCAAILVGLLIVMLVRRATARAA